ncbi:hypothetical protein NC651_016412 [Populus alba x Populus x berolinensis]|nr:hypothetical protein NC651_016412 [Populus alba x Populus x berolinensis]
MMTKMEIHNSPKKYKVGKKRTEEVMASTSRKTRDKLRCSIVSLMGIYWNKHAL